VSDPGSSHPEVVLLALDEVVPMHRPLFPPFPVRPVRRDAICPRCSSWPEAVAVCRWIMTSWSGGPESGLSGVRDHVTVNGEAQVTPTLRVLFHLSRKLRSEQVGARRSRLQLSLTPRDYDPAGGVLA
jgi:hypothetical protein